MKITATLLALLCAMVFAQEKGQLTDSRDKKNYKTVKIGEQTWMAENLNFNAKGSLCSGKKEANCTKYGRLYDWVTAMALPDSCYKKSCVSQINANHQGICPSGWHIPSNADWNALMKFINPDCSEKNPLYKGSACVVWQPGGSGKPPCTCQNAGTKLRTTSGWLKQIPAGTDDYGFSALPGGTTRNGYYDDVGAKAEWHSATEYNLLHSHSWNIYSSTDGKDVSGFYRAKIDEYKHKVGLSVRCLQD